MPIFWADVGHKSSDQIVPKPLFHLAENSPNIMIYIGPRDPDLKDR